MGTVISVVLIFFIGWFNYLLIRPFKTELKLNVYYLRRRPHRSKVTFPNDDPLEKRSPIDLDGREHGFIFISIKNNHQCIKLFMCYDNSCLYVNFPTFVFLFFFYIEL